MRLLLTLSLILLVSSSYPCLAIAKDNDSVPKGFYKLEVVSAKNPKLNLFSPNNDKKINLAEKSTIRLSFDPESLFINKFRKQESVRLDLFEIVNSKRKYISSQTITLGSARSRTTVNMDLGRFSKSSKNIQVDIYDTENRLVNTYATSIEAEFLGAQSNIEIENLNNNPQANCSPGAFDDCYIEHILNRIVFEGRAQAQISTRVVKTATGKYLVSIPVPTQSFSPIKESTFKAQIIGKDDGSITSVDAFAEQVLPAVNIGDEISGFSQLNYDDALDQLNVSFNGDDTNVLSISSTGRVGIGTNSPSAFLDLAPGNTTTPQVKFRPGTLSNAPQNGSLEYDGNNFYFTVNNSRIPLIGAGSVIGATSITANNISGSLSKSQLPSTLVYTGDVQNLSSKTLTDTVLAGPLRITSGSPAAGKLLRSDNNGLVSWQSPLEPTVLPELSSVGKGNTLSVLGDLDISGSLSADDELNIGNGALRFYNDGSGLRHLHIEGGAGASVISTGVNNPLYIQSTGASFINMGSGLILNSSGSTKLQLIGADGTEGIIRSPDHNLVFQTGASNTERMRLSNSGGLAISTNVGIGTNSPSQALEIYGGDPDKGRVTVRVDNPNPSITLTGASGTGYAPNIDLQQTGSPLLSGGILSTYSPRGGLSIMSRTGNTWLTTNGDYTNVVVRASLTQNAPLQAWTDTNGLMGASIGPISNSNQRQKFSLYNTLEDFASPINYERLAIYPDSTTNVFKIESENGGSGSTRDLALQTGGGNTGINDNSPDYLLDVNGSLGVAGDATFAGTIISNSSLGSESLSIGGGYGSSGVTISSDGAIQANSNLTVDGTTLLTGAVTTSNTADIAGNTTIGGGYGSSGVTISSDGAIQANSNLTVDGITNLGNNLSVSGSETITGNLGIGTNSPSQALEIYGGANKGRVQVDVSGANPNLIISGDPANGYYPSLEFRPISVPNSGGAITGYDGRLLFYPSANGSWFYSPRATSEAIITKGFTDQTAPLQKWIDISENTLASIGPISLSDQRQKFSIYNTLETTPVNYERLSIYPNSANNSFHIDAEQGGSGTLRNLGLQVSGGNVGIGIDTPSALLDVNGGIRIRGAVNNNALTVNSSAQVGIGMKASSILFGFDVAPQTNFRQDLLLNSGAGVLTASANVFSVRGGSSYDLDLGSNAAPGVVRITTGGNVGIGTTSPNYKLHVVGTAGLSTGATWTNASDIRLKDVRGSYDYGLDEIMALNPIRFSYKRNNPLGLPSEPEIVGFSAQEVKTVIPDAVKTREDGYLELNVDPIHWAMLNSIKELKQEIEELKSELAKLKTNHY